MNTNEHNINEGAEFTYSLFPPQLLSVLPGLKKIRPFTRKFSYDVAVNDEKMAMKLTVRGFLEEDIDFRISNAPVKWGKEEWPAAPPTKWFIYENNSSTLAFADEDMEYCICGFLYLLQDLGKKEILKRIRKNRLRIQKNKPQPSSTNQETQTPPL